MAFLDFSQDELGDPLSEEEKVGAARLWGPCSLHGHCFLRRPGLSLLPPVTLTDEVLFTQNPSQSRAGLGVFP